MLRVAVISIFPEMLDAISEYGISGRAVESGLLELSVFNPRDYSTDKHRNIDDRPYGGGPGMVMMAEPMLAAIRDARNKLTAAKTVYLSPQGQRLDQDAVVQLAEDKEYILIAGRYEGIDERIIDAEIDFEWSIGDYVLSGGELPAMVLIDAMVRLQPGALGHEDSADEDSFSNGLLDCPHYTRPESVEDKAVPAVLLQGNHAEIRRWRLKQALGRTQTRRPDLFNKFELNAEQQSLLEEYLQESLNTE